MKRLLSVAFLAPSVGVGACASAPAADGPLAAVDKAWLASVVDLDPQEVQSRLGAPIRSELDLAGQLESCFTVTPPWTERCVTYLDGRVFADRARLEVAPARLSGAFGELQRAVSVLVGRESTEVHRFVFTPGQHALYGWAARGFHAGESCALQAASDAARAADPDGLSADAPELLAALRAGQACLHATWGEAASLRTGESSRPEHYGLGLYQATVDPGRRARQAELDAQVREHLKKRFRARESDDAVKSEGGTESGAPGEATPE
jgi:hypothetical protein